jgi:flagellar hook assembly protein FlgD
MSFTIASPSHTTLTLFNVQGQVVRKLVDERKERGTYSVVWDGRDAMGRLVSSGVYLVRMEAADFRAARTVVLAR